MKAGTYHREVWMPPEFLNYFNGKHLELSLTDHAKKASESDRYGHIVTPTSLTIEKNRIIEVEVAVGKAPKVVVRQPYTEKNDLILAVIVEGKRGVVKTVWLNQKNDLHSTLDKSKYVSQ